jgi:hypothetical protein
MTILEQLQNFKGSQIIGLDTLVEVKLTGGKKNPMQGRVKKMTTGNLVMLFKNGNGYKNMVTRRLKKQFSDIITTMEIFERISSPTWTPGERAWGERVPKSPFIEHKGKLYLDTIFIRPGKSTYYLDGVEIEKDQIIGLPEKNEGDQGGLIDKVIVRTFALESIIKIRKGKKEMLGPTIV